MLQGLVKDITLENYCLLKVFIINMTNEEDLRRLQIQLQCYNSHCNIRKYDIGQDAILLKCLIADAIFLNIFNPTTK